MRQATPGSGPPPQLLRPAVASASASAAPAAPTSSVEIIPVKQGEGMKRGKWEAPAWAFWAILAVVLVGSTLYLLRRLGLLSRAKRQDKP
jgi:hypothetical protein